MYWIMPCTYMKTQTCTCMLTHNHIRLPACMHTRSYMHTQGDLSAADTFNIEPRPRPALCIYM